MADPTPAAKPLPSSVFDWASLAAIPTPMGERRDLFDAPTATFANFECHVTTLNPGEAPHEPHHHPDEEIVIVKEGLLEATINGVPRRAAAGSFLFFASNDEHGLRNAGPARTTYFVMRIVTRNAS